MNKHALMKELIDRISSGLTRKSITTCSRWTEQYRVMPGSGKWKWDLHPWLKEMHDCNCRMAIGRKSAQMGFTEWALNTSFFTIDITRKDVLYVLPSTSPDASDFSSSRFDSALELSPHIAKMFTDVKNVGLKRCGAASMYLRGSRSRPGLKSIPVALLIMDEINEFTQENIPLALERQSGQMEKKCLMLSTPTIDNKGIDAYYKTSTQEHFFFNCPACGRKTELTYPECLVITAEELHDSRIKESHYVCKECKNKLVHEDKRIWLAKNEWVPGNSSYDDRGFYINQMYSSTITPVEMAQAALKARYNIADEQELYNSKLGLPHIPDGSNVNDDMINQCIGDHINTIAAAGVNTLGVDQGRALHYVITNWKLPDAPSNDVNTDSISKQIVIGKCTDFSELDKLMADYGIVSCVLDAQPERRLALQFALRHRGRVKLAFYGRGVNGKQIHVHTDGECGITVDRTAWLDLSLGRFRSKRTILPRNTPEEFKQHIKSLVRILRNDKDGNPVGFYEKRENDHDHYAHANNYAEMALQFGLRSKNRDITDY